ncbi:CHRD domain-containing protein [Novosphingobium sp. Gsoil 351]|uniref:CHRD domain-containing protein n=1 Tax=Novosphingobium sp. Gsoil 351 TaxID=2675225 RepID=UPI0018A84C23|nr:CHRD domain-containing protein [Novosphingobium sp. Gsoil 351]
MKALHLVLTAAFVAVQAGPAQAQATAAAPEPAAAASVAPTSGKLTATLVGDLEVPDDGDPDGAGSAAISIEGGKLCYKVEYHHLAPVTMAHIHVGAAGKAGEPVVNLTLDADENIAGCTPIASDLAARLLAEPGAYYVNVHTTELPKGAIRGQLGK